MAEWDKYQRNSSLGHHEFGSGRPWDAGFRIRLVFREFLPTRFGATPGAPAFGFVGLSHVPSRRILHPLPADRFDAMHPR